MTKKEAVLTIAGDFKHQRTTLPRYRKMQKCLAVLGLSPSESLEVLDYMEYGTWIAIDSFKKNG